jgi:predicted RNase H-like HicB family nuclease
MKVYVIIEKGKDGTYDACMEVNKNLDFGLLGQGNTVEEAINDFMTCKDDMQNLYSDMDKPFPEDLEFNYKYDMQSFLAYYSDIFTKPALEKITGINQKQFFHYASGRSRPSKRTMEKIDNSFRRFSNELNQVHFV